MNDQSTNPWPKSTFSFAVNIDGLQAFFSEVTGLNSETEIIEYRRGNSRKFSTHKMPGLQKFGNVTLKRGILKGDINLWPQFLNATQNKAGRKTISISLMDEAGNVAMTWKLTNAFPVKVEGPGLNAASDEVVIESIEIAHEGLTMG